MSKMEKRAKAKYRVCVEEEEFNKILSRSKRKVSVAHLILIFAAAGYYYQS